VSGDKTRTTRLRRAAQRQGVTITRSRRRDPRALDYGWTLDDPRAGIHLAGLTTDAVEHYLTTGQPPATD
jgi:hypothetical protein